MLTDVAGYLETQGHGIYIPNVAGEEQTIFVESVPESPDHCIMLFQSGGMGRETHFGGAGSRRPAIQVRVRSAANDPGTGIAKIEAIADTLDAQRVTIGSTVYEFFAMGDWGPIGSDKQDRPERTQNFRVRMT